MNNHRPNTAMAEALVRDQRDFAKKHAMRVMHQEIVNAAIRVGIEADTANAWMLLSAEVFIDVVTLELGEEKCAEVLAIVKEDKGD